MKHARTSSAFGALGGLRALGAGASAVFLGLGCQVLADVDADRLPSSSATVGATSTASSGGGQGGAGGAGGQTTSTSGGAGGSGGEGGQGGSGGQGPCATAADCPSPENPCQLAKCTAGVCGTGNIAAGVPSTVQTPGDCNQSLCNGSGLAFDSPIFNDVFDDGEPCTDDFCANGSPVNAPSAAGQACSHNGGTQCDGAGSCVVCLSSADCPGTGCSVFGACVASCDDGLEDGAETDVDCGGNCGPCPDLAGCVIAADCQSGLCVGNLCLAPTCLDGTKNGDEKGVDCGGGCPGCATGTACSVPTDCQSGVCAGVCLAPQCNDGVANGSETGVDCGGGPGSGCAACPDASPCNVATDCQLGVCTQGHCCGVPHDCTGQCGSLVGSCGVPVDCGGCADPGESCGGGGASNQCGCTAEPLALTCGGAVCGSATNNCGDLVDCGSCPAPLGCGLGSPGTPGQCGCVAPCGTPLWNATFGGAGNDRGLAVALAPGGELIVAGSFQGTMTLGATTLVSAGSDDVFVARLTSTGVPLWAQRFGDGASQAVSGVAVDNLGNVLISGDFAGTVNFGGANLTSAGSTDVFIVKLSSAGAHTWSKRAGDVQAQTSAGIAVDGAGNAWLAGSYQGTIGLGGATFATTGADDVFVAKLDAAGNHLFSASYGKGAQVSHQATSVAVAADGSVAISGFAAGSIDFGGGPLNTAGGLDAFVAKLDPAGAVVFGKVWGDALLQRAHGVAFDGAGNVLVTGESEGSVNFGLGALTAQGTADAFVVALGPTGTALWSRLLGGPNVQIGRSIAADGAGNVVIAGEFAGNLDASGAGTQVLVSAGSLDAFVAKLDGAGSAVWSQRFGDVGLERVGGVTASLAGDTTLVGTFQGTLDFGQGPVPGAGGDDVFLMQRGP